MASQEQVDGALPWYQTLLNSTGQRLADNLVPPAEKTADQTGSEDLSGSPTAPQRAAGLLGDMGSQKTLLLVGGGLLAVVAVVAMTGRN